MSVEKDLDSRQAEEDVSQELTDMPTCMECGSKRGIKPALHSQNGPFYCIECCNYVDGEGRLVRP